ncbi:MAG: hypothetical protein AB7V56_04830 [Candidatus Nitrosocosmicus sp.]
MDNDGDVYILKYSDDADDFDSSEFEEIRNDMLNSFRFIDSKLGEDEKWMQTIFSQLKQKHLVFILLLNQLSILYLIY